MIFEMTQRCQPMPPSPAQPAKRARQKKKTAGGGLFNLAMPRRACG